MRRAILILLIVGCLLAGCQSIRLQYNKQPCIIPFEGFSFLTCEEFKFKLNNRNYIVPKHFETDLASVPRWFWSFFPPQRKEFIAPAIIHDYLYACTNATNRHEADSVFYYALRKEGVSVLTSYKMWVGVRIGGGLSYGQRKCQSINEATV